MPVRKTVSPILGAVSVAAALVGTPIVSSAESACKGLEQAACAAKASCSWTNSYTRNDGKQVSGYCRTKPGGTKVKASQEAPDSGQIASKQ